LPRGEFASANRHKFQNKLAYRPRHADDLNSYETAPKTGLFFCPSLLPVS
jgi:hypothetical protein